MRINFTSRIIPLLIMVTLFLSACGSDISREVTFLPKEAWTADVQLNLPQETMMFIGSQSDLEQMINDSVARMEVNGANVKWKSRAEGSELVYDFSIKGEGMDLLNEAVFESRATIEVLQQDGKEQIHFFYSVSPDLSNARQNTVILHGGEIVNSNGEKSGTGTVQWHNAAAMEATIRPKNNLLIILFIAAAILGAAGIVWFIWQRWRRKEVIAPLVDTVQPEQVNIAQQPSVNVVQPVSAAVFCRHCGSQLNPAAKFCPSCGKQRL